METEVDEASAMVAKKANPTTGMYVTQNNVKMRFGPPPKRMKTLGQKVAALRAPNPAKKSEAETGKGKKKVVGSSLPKSVLNRKYVTRASMTFKSKFHGNDNAPIDIE